MAASPLISVLMPVFNGSKYLAESIQSILAQKCTDFELIIVDDGSTDDTLELARGLAARDARIIVLSAPHGGRSRARNACIAAARGEYIAWQDADDISLPNRLATQIDWMRSNRLDICGSCARMFGAGSQLMWFPEKNNAVRCELFFRASLLQPTVMLKTDIAKANLYAEGIAFEDYEMWARLAPHYRLGNVPQVLLMYRGHENQSHLLESIEFHADLLQLSGKLFAALFPQAGPADCAVVSALVAKQPAVSLQELENMGVWLLRFSQAEDKFFRRGLLGRWRGACKRAAYLGLGVYRLYLKTAPGFQLSAQPVQAALFFMCLLRLRSDSRLFTTVNFWRQIVLTKIRAAKLRRIKSFLS